MGEISGPAAFSGDELQTWSSLATVLEWLPALLDAQLQRDAGLTHFEYGLLYALSVAPDRTLRLSVLAGYANSSLTKLSRAVTRLERRQWVRRTTDPTDGRYTLATLTELGWHQVDEAMPGHVATVRRLVLTPLTAAQHQQLRDITQSILTAAGPGHPWRSPTADTPVDMDGHT
ncbi:DNA-binding transcriptional regulator, MarR family [Blastococcus aurantiacus]|uniref:DNA-binding transcriptional regulator, MarR family n=1 Tax=Blastococcus aurantiacus TaxID=1550231 RepID=A0A1G7HHS3_9ACTN|nr:MarR family transcriptional regulator [Blastococcus aurantiacus]SDF00032.1 DNA-binding transcriptional regulator, MarR family [Blastococcus aurantiacus]